MKLDGIEGQIVAALADEGETGRMAQVLRENAVRQERVSSEAELEGAAAFVTEYVRHVPAYMRAGLEAATRAGVGGAMRAVLDDAVAYWAMPMDIIPDQFGLLGILDDAYCSLTLMQGVSDRYARETGIRFFPDNLTAANQAVRQLIGEPEASQLDMYVGGRLESDPMLQAVRALTAMASSIGAGIMDPAVSAGPTPPPADAMLAFGPLGRA